MRHPITPRDAKNCQEVCGFPSGVQLQQQATAALERAQGQAPALQKRDCPRVKAVTETKTLTLLAQVEHLSVLRKGQRTLREVAAAAVVQARKYEVASKLSHALWIWGCKCLAQGLALQG